jgi:hypothetical protein
VVRIEPRARDADCDSGHGARQLRKRHVPPAWRRIPLLPARRPLLRAHRGSGRQARRLRDRLHLRRLPAAAIPDRLPRRPLPGAVDRLGLAPEGEGWAALVPPATRAPGRPQGCAALDRQLQNWALQCAECHSTNLRKGYDAASHTYRSTFSEINVACEACHGPGSRHVAWASGAKPPYPAQGRHRAATTRQPLVRGVEVSRRRRPRRRARQALRPCRHERLRRLPRAPIDPERRAQARRSTRRQPPAGDAHRPQLPRRWPAAGRGLCLGLLPAEPDAAERRHLHGLPRAALAADPRQGQRPLQPLPQRRPT